MSPPIKLVKSRARNHVKELSKWLQEKKAVMSKPAFVELAELVGRVYMEGFGDGVDTARDVLGDRA